VNEREGEMGVGAERGGRKMVQRERGRKMVKREGAKDSEERGGERQ